MKFTKSQFRIVGSWHRGMLQGQENMFLYEIYRISDGMKIGRTYTSKAKASAYLGKVVRAANLISQGKFEEASKVMEG